MRNTKEPTTKIPTRLFQLEMPKEGEEYLLRDFFCVVDGHAEGENIAQQWVAKFFEEFQDRALDFRRLRRRRGFGNGGGE